MATKETRKIESSLLSKGFSKENTHHEMYWYFYNGKKTSIRTRLSHGYKEYSDNLLGLIARQLHLKKSELEDLIDCPLTKEQYEALLLKDGKIKVEETVPKKEAKTEGYKKKRKK